MVVDAGPEPTPTVQPLATGGVRAGFVVLGGVIALNAGNYLFHLIAARHLGPARYGDLATLITLSSLVSLPLSGVQIWVARYVAQRRAGGQDETIRWFIRRVSFYLTLIGCAASLLFLALAWPIKHALGIASIAAVLITALTTFPSVVTPLPWGLAQGLERFSLVALAYGFGPVARLGLVFITFAAGLKVGGAMLATLASMLVALLLPLVALRSWWRPAEPTTRDIGRGDAMRSLLPVMVGLLAITALTSDDVVVAKAALSSHEAGIYGSGSLVGRVVLYLPAAIMTVLLPRVAARVAGHRSTDDLLVRSVASTFAFCVVGTLGYSVIGGPITRIAFGSDYSAAAGLLWLFGVAMSGYAVLNVLLIYHLGREDSRMSFLLLAGAAAQLVLFALIHQSPHQLLYIDIVVAAGLLAAHELVLDRGLISAFARRP